MVFEIPFYSHNTYTLNCDHSRTAVFVPGPCKKKTGQELDSLLHCKWMNLITGFSHLYFPFFLPLIAIHPSQIHSNHINRNMYFIRTNLPYSRSDTCVFVMFVDRVIYALYFLLSPLAVWQIGSKEILLFRGFEWTLSRIYGYNR